MSEKVSKKKPTGRVELTREKYKDRITPYTFNLLVTSDPSGNHKYLEWMAKQVAIHGYGRCKYHGDTYEHCVVDITNLVSKFHKMSNRLTPTNTYSAIDSTLGSIPRGLNIRWNGDLGKYIVTNSKDINAYNNYRILITILKTIEKRFPTEAEIRKERDVVYEDDTILVVAPLTERASIKYGSGTRWCTAAINCSAFNSYTSSTQGLIYFIFKEGFRRPSNFRYCDERESGEKMALNWRIRDNKKLHWSWYDVVDSTISSNEAPKWLKEYYTQLKKGDNEIDRRDYEPYDRFSKYIDNGNKEAGVVMAAVLKYIRKKDNRNRLVKFFNPLT